MKFAFKRRLKWSTIANMDKIRSPNSQLFMMSNLVFVNEGPLMPLKRIMAIFWFFINQIFIVEKINFLSFIIRYFQPLKITQHKKLATKWPNFGCISDCWAFLNSNFIFQQEKRKKDVYILHDSIYRQNSTT